MKCCGHDVETAYCPECGAKSGSSALKQLHQHLAGRQRISKKELENIIKWAESPNCAIDDERYKQDKINRRRKQFDKWTRWADAVEKAVEGASK